MKGSDLYGIRYNVAKSAIEKYVIKAPGRMLGMIDEDIDVYSCFVYYLGLADPNSPTDPKEFLSYMGERLVFVSTHPHLVEHPRTGDFWYAEDSEFQDQRDVERSFAHGFVKYVYQDYFGEYPDVSDRTISSFPQEKSFLWSFFTVDLVRFTQAHSRVFIPAILDAHDPEGVQTFIKVLSEDLKVPEDHFHIVWKWVRDEHPVYIITQEATSLLYAWGYDRLLDQREALFEGLSTYLTYLITDGQDIRELKWTKIKGK